MRIRYPYQSPEPGESGGGAAAEDRGDDFEPKPDVAKLNPDKPVVDAAADAAVALEKELEKPVEKVQSELDLEGKEGDKDKPKDTRIPLARHKEILERERQGRELAERQLAQYQKGADIAVVNKEITALEDTVLKLEDQFATLVVEGRPKDAAAVMAQIRKADRQIGEAKSDMKMQELEIRSTERARYDVTLARVEGAYPELNPDGTEYDAALEARVFKLHKANQHDGMTPSAALQDAVTFVMGAAKTGKQKEATEVTARVDAAGKQDLGAERARAEKAKTAEAVAKSAPLLKDVGLDSGKAGGGALSAQQAIKLSQADFAKLADSDLAAMRGDVL